MQISVFGFFIVVEAVVCSGEDMPHKSDVVIKALKIFKSRVKQLLGPMRRFKIFLVFRVVVEKMVKPAPEARRPYFGRYCFVYSVFVNSVGKLVARAQGYFGKLRVYFLEGFLCPRSVFGEYFFNF